MLVPLREARSETCGAKAASLGAMLRAGLPVPDGFVVPFAVQRAHTDHTGRLRADPLPPALLEALGAALDRLGADAVAVRSSAAGEDTTASSAAGQYDSTLAVQGVTSVAAALRTCWASLRGARATAYRARLDGVDGASGETPAMAVVVQRHLDADVAGVVFTRPGPGEETVVEAAWGLGPSVVSGTVTPDVYRVGADGSVTAVVADKATRLDRVGARLVTTDVAARHRRRATLDHAGVRAVADLAERVADRSQDVEWALADGRLWLLQARPVTVLPPSAPPSGPPSAASSEGPLTLTGTPGSRGTVTGRAATVRGPADFVRVRPGDVLVCPFTDPAWTPLLRIAGGVVTETGGALSHAAIVARELGVPAVLGVPDAVDRVPDGKPVTVDGSTGTVTIPRAG